MAGPSIVVRVLGDLKGLGSSLGDAGKKGEDAGKRIGGAFTGILGTLNKTGVLGPFGESLGAISDSLDGIMDKSKGFSDKMLGLGGALAGVGVGLSALGSKDKASQQQLQAAVEATGQSYSDYQDEIEAAVKKNEKFGDSASQTQDALRVLTQATGSPTKALDLLGTATDLAAAKHQNLFDAATSLGKVYNGNTRLLKEFGISTSGAGDATKALATATKQSQSADDNLTHAKRTLADIEAVDAGRKHLTVGQAIQLRNAQEAVRTATEKATTAHKNLNTAQTNAKNSSKDQGKAVDELGAKLHGQAAAAADTFTGKLKGITTAVEDQAAAFGAKYGPALTAAGAAMGITGGLIKGGAAALDIFTQSSKDAAAATDTVAAAEEGADAAGAPMLLTMGLIVLAVIALVAIGYVIYRNWSTIWGAIKAIIRDVWTWIKTNWPLLLAILLGPIAVAALEIVKHWNDIKAGFKAALDAIKAAWATFVGWLTGLAGSIARIAAGMWHGISDAFGTATAAIKTGWSIFWGWFTGLPSDIANAAAGMWSGIYGAFKSAVDSVIGLWNTLASYTALHIHIGIPHLPGINVDTPQLIPSIPKLAQGGLITSDGLIYAHAGEAISPIPHGFGGPAVAIQHADFEQSIDVDLFMKRVAWNLQRARV